MIRRIHTGKANAFWLEHRDASRNWLALGLLLAAWNASDNEVPRDAQRPASLRGYGFVSVRAAQRSPENFFAKVTKASTNCKASCL